MLQQVFQMSPSELMARHKDNLLTIKSTEDARRPDPTGLQRGQYHSLNPELVTMRYEPDTKRLCVDAEWLRMIWFDDNSPVSNSLFRNLQYAGLSTARLVKGTGHSMPPRRVHVFDLREKDAIRSINTQARESYRRAALRKHKGDVKLAAADMTRYDNLKWGIDMGENMHKDDMQRLLKEAKDTLKKLDRHALGLKPLRRKKKEKRHMQEIDNMMNNHTNRITVVRTYLDKTQPIPGLATQEHYAPRERIIGMLKESINRDGTNHKKQLYLQVSAIKDMSTREYRNDIRYTHSQSTYVKTTITDKNGHETIVPVTLYCAVFDLLRR